MGDELEQPYQRLVTNPLLGDVVAQSPGRMSRREGAIDCPFCADLAADRWPASSDTWIRPNDFSALRPPLGECFILLYARQHDLTFAGMSAAQAMAVIDLWQEIYIRLSAQYACVMTFENAGEAIGQTQSHPHGQTYGVSFVPPTIARERDHFIAARKQTGHCLGCDLVVTESDGPRLVSATPHWVGFVPSYARYPYEVHLYARTHIGTIGEAPRGGEEARELADMLLALVRAYDKVYAAPMPYMLVIHQLADPDFHLHLELLPVGRAVGKLKFAASAETGFGLWLNDALPEAKAKELRDVIKDHSAGSRS